MTLSAAPMEPAVAYQKRSLISESSHRGVRFTPAGAAARLAGDQRVVRGGDGTGNRTGKKGEKKRLPILST